MLMYRSCRCCRRIWNKLLHTTFHLLAIPCIAMAFIAVYDSHVLNTVPDPQDPEKRLPKPIPDFYSLHSWMGFATMGLFALQVHFPSVFLSTNSRGSQFSRMGITVAGKWMKSKKKLERIQLHHHIITFKKKSLRLCATLWGVTTPQASTSKGVPAPCLC